MAMNNAFRSCVSKLHATTASVVPKPGNRGFHSSGVKSMGGHGRVEPFYVHAKRMYNLDRMKNQEIKMTLGCSFFFFGIGIFPPLFATWFQMKKAKSA